MRQAQAIAYFANVSWKLERLAMRHWRIENASAGIVEYFDTIGNVMNGWENQTRKARVLDIDVRTITAICERSRQARGEFYTWATREGRHFVPLDFWVAIGRSASKTTTRTD